MKKNISLFFYIILIFVSILTLFWRFIVFSEIPVPYKMDYIRFLTQQIRTVEDIKSGFFPLWNPYILCGMPTIANAMTNLFSPFIPIYFMLKDPIIGYIVIIVLELFILALSFFYMMKKLFTVSNIAAYTAAISFTLCGFMFWNLNIPMRGIVDILCFYPLSFICYYKLRNSMNLKWGILLALVLALGHINSNASILQHGYNLVFLSLFHLFFTIFINKNYKDELKFTFYFIISIILSFGLDAFQLIPVVDAVNESTRFTGVVEYSPEKFIPTFFSFIYPDVWPVFQIGNISFIRSLQYGVIGYISIPALILASIGAFYYQDRKKWFFILYPLTYLIVWPLYTQPIIQKILPNFIKSANHLFYSFYLYSFCVAVLAGLGIQVIKNNIFSIKDLIQSKKIAIVCIKSELFFLMILYITGLSVLITLYIGFDKIAPFMQHTLFEKITNTDSLTRSSEFYTDKISHFLIVLYSYLPIFILSNLSVCAGLISIYIILFRQINYKRVLLGIIPVCVLFNMLAVGNQHIKWSPRDYYYPETPEVKFLQEINKQEFFRICVFYDDSSWFWENNPNASFEEFYDFSYDLTGSLHENIIIRFGFQQIGGYEGLCPNRQFQYFKLLGDNRGFGTHGIFLAELDSPLLDVLNMKYVLSPEQTLSDKFEKLFTGSRYCVYLNKAASQRAFIVPEAEYIESQDELFGILAGGNVDFSRKVFISEKNPHIKYPDNNGGEFIARAEIMEYTPNKVVIKTDSNRNGWLVLADAYNPGWSARIDSKPAQIYPANHLLRAVPVDAGTHTVTFSYFSRYMYVGIIVSLGCAVICILLVMSGMLRKNSSDLH